MGNGRALSNRSGMNGPVQDLHCLVTGDHVADESDDLCCAALSAAITNLSEQVSNLSEVIDGMSSMPLSPTVVVRNVCLANGTAQLAYDIIPAGVTDPAEIVTIYRPYPAEEGECVCLV